MMWGNFELKQVLVSVLVWASMVLPSPQMRISSAIALVPASPSKLSPIRLWNSSGATLMPKGILSHFILLTEVLKVVSRELGWDMPESRLDISQGK